MSGRLAGRRVLITGGEGFIGSNLAAACLAEGAIVRSLDVGLAGTGYDPRNLDGLDVERLTGDIRDSKAVEAALDGVDLVFHCAATTAHGRSLKAPLENLSINAEGALVIFESVRAVNPTATLVYVGTTTQLGPIGEASADEDHAQQPVELYSAHKMLAERAALIYGKSHGLAVSAVRLPNVYGPRMAVHDPGLSFLGWFIGLGLRGERLTVFRPGTQLRNIIHVDDAVEGLIRAGLRDETRGQVTVVGHPAHAAVIDAARAIAAHIGGEAALVDWPAGRKAIEVGHARLDCRRSWVRLGWKPGITLADGLARTGAWFRRHREAP